MSHFVYILRCADDSLYTGYTNDIDKRVDVHNKGKGAKYTRGRRPVRLVFYEEVSSMSEGLRLERTIKKFSKKKKEDLVHSFGLEK
ncbi:GIY-YIG nuclease family protein [Anaerococcus tetradius]|uniref:GIY-YIG catalytic domain protein n=2 Tax=Anaerococcus tetradius TaxID=33036 RepID=C2CGQ7_9FIRM|nr:GIY-YIG nuclease family protein [Anaerococcus tetradius]EEI83321.1 GIY-YIG catalytic domain protein [Anaerococcus tetradius ATCC 35098]KWZ75768.1 GIY-YIG catalytic domain protein [Anaerococcus tetradius]